MTPPALPKTPAKKIAVDEGIALGFKITIGVFLACVLIGVVGAFVFAYYQAAVHQAALAAAKAAEEEEQRALELAEQEYIEEIRANRMKAAALKGKTPYWPTERERQNNLQNIPQLAIGGVYATAGQIFTHPYMMEDPDEDYYDAIPSRAGTQFQCVAIENYNGLLYYKVRFWGADESKEGFMEASQLYYLPHTFVQIAKIVTVDDVIAAENARIAQEEAAAIAQANAEHIANNKAAAQARGRASNSAKAEASRAAAAAQQQYRENNAEASRQTIDRARAQGIIR